MPDTPEKTIDVLATRLANAEATLAALREGSVDALAVHGGEGQQAFAPESVDLPYRNFLERMGEGALALDAAAKVIFCNRLFIELVGRTRNAVLGMQLESFIAPEYRRLYRAALNASGPQRVGAALIASDGRLIPVQISLTSSGAGDARRWNAVVSDLSSAERLSAVSAAHEAAEAASLAKDHFLALLGHELRTPLAVMMGWTEYLLQQKQPDEAKTLKALSTIKRNALLQQKLIEDLLDISRIVSGRLQIERRELDLVTLAKDVAASLALRAEAAGLELGLNIGEPVLVRGDPQRLEQVLTNLVGNAIKFTPKGGRVRIAIESEGDSARIDVQDSGVGIDASTLPRVFQLFRQGDGERQRESGLGVGLTITKHLVELHDGSVQVQSDGLGRGSTFSVKLPVVPVAPAPSNSVSTWPSQERLPNSRVLVVDDEHEMREITARMLRSFGADVVDVVDATSALARLEREQFDLVVSDIMMPGVDGMAFARALRERHGGQPPLLALTALSGGVASEQARRAGFSAFLTKPVTSKLLYRTVHDLLAKPAADA